jgi:AcrR family transcriptional regulator
MTTIDETTAAPDHPVGPAARKTPKAPMRKDAARNRALLIEAGREVFARRGLEASLDDIARQAGLGVGTAYRHFANKYDLATAIMHEAIGEVVREAEYAAQVPDPWEGLVGFLEAVLNLQTKDRGLRETMMGVHDPQKSDEVHHLLIGPVSTLLQRAQAAGAVRADARTSDLGCVIMMLCQVADLAGDVAPGLWRRYLPTLLAGLRVGGTPLPGEPLTDEEFRVASMDHMALKQRAGTVPLS